MLISFFSLLHAEEIYQYGSDKHQLFIEVDVEGDASQRHLFLVNPNLNYSLIKEDLVETLKLPTQDRGTLTQSRVNLGIDNQSLDSFLFVVDDIIPNSSVQGVLGLNAFQSFIMDIDLGQNQLKLHYKSSESLNVQPITFKNNRIQSSITLSPDLKTEVEIRFHTSPLTLKPEVFQSEKKTKIIFSDYRFATKAIEGNKNSIGISELSTSKIVIDPIKTELACLSSRSKKRKNYLKFKGQKLDPPNVMRARCVLFGVLW